MIRSPAKATAVAAVAMVALAACSPSGSPAPAPTGVGNASAMPVTGTTDATGARVGSKLSADVGPLSGSVTGFSTRTSDLGTVVALDADVLFDFDKATLRPDAAAALQRTAEAIRRGGSGSVAVYGFTDAKGDDDYNLELSRQRAQAVTDWLLGQPGIKAHDFEVRGKGEAEPVAPNARPDGSDDPAGRARNRRVEIVIPKA